MNEIFQKRINRSIGGCKTIRKLMDLLKEINIDYYDKFIKLVKINTFDYYKCVETKYIDKMLYMMINRYHGILIELLDRCAPDGYYFGLCNENLSSLYGDSYGFWKEEPNENLKKLIIEKIIIILKEKSNSFSIIFRWKYLLHLDNNDLEKKLYGMLNKKLLELYTYLIDIIEFEVE